LKNCDLLHKCYSFDSDAYSLAQARLADDQQQLPVAGHPADSDTYESVTCILCQRVHLVNPRTGRVLGENDE
jgi:hypothetical protein